MKINELGIEQVVEKIYEKNNISVDGMRIGKRESSCEAAESEVGGEEDSE